MTVPTTDTGAYTLCFLHDRVANAVVLLDRASTRTHLPGVLNGLGGKLNPGEDIVAAARREIREESGLLAINLEWRGTESWICTRPDGSIRDRGTLFLCVASTWSGTLQASCAEGTLAWHSLADVPTHPRLAPNLATLLAALLADPGRRYAGVARYVEEGPEVYRLVDHGYVTW